MRTETTLLKILRWIPWLAVFILGLLYLGLVHPVPGIICLLLSMVFFPPSNDIVYKQLGFKTPLPVKVLLFVILFWFTLGVSELGDMID